MYYFNKNIVSLQTLFRANKPKRANICHTNNQNHLCWLKTNQGWMDAKQRMMRRSPCMRCNISESESAISLKQTGQSSMHRMEVITLSSAFSGLIWDWGAGCWTVGGTAAGSAGAAGGAPAGWVVVGWMGTGCCWAADACLRRALRAGAVGGAGLDGGGVATAFWGAGLAAATGTPPPPAAAVMGIGCTGCHTDRHQTTIPWCEL